MAVEEATLIETVEVAELPAGGVTGFVPKVMVNPDGMPAAVRATGEANPPIDVIVTVAVPELPCPIVRLEGETVIVKSGGGPDEVTCRVSGAECDAVPLDPVTVSV